MTTLDQYQASELVKLLLLGDSKVGKTSSLVSLVKAGYKLRILDLDNLLHPLAELIMKECPDKITNVAYRTLRDKRKMTDLGPIIDGAPKAFPRTIKMLDRWRYKHQGEVIDLGQPYTWGPDTILVIDSLSRLCDAAIDWRLPLTPVGESGKFDGRATYQDAQNAVEDVLATLTGDNFRTNVIVICHGLYMSQEDGTRKIFPQSVGQKLSPKIPQYFPTYVRYMNKTGKRLIQVKSDTSIDLATPPAISKELPTDTGLATIFEVMQGKLIEEEKETKQISLKRA